jgi:D-alanyl-D-alanine carboxypeptidase (penicillin-binding protein 5/6)
MNPIRSSAAKRIVAFFCCFTVITALLLPCIGLFAKAEGLSELPLDTAETIYLYNIENKVAIVEQNCDALIYPASTVKIMTGIIAVEHLASRLDEKITVVPEMLTRVVGQQCNWLTPGETPTVRDLLYHAFCGSYNDAVAIITYIVSGGEEAYVTLMNARAQELGMTSTVYTNATGVHDPKMVTTAKDIATLTLAASRIPLLMEVVSASDYVSEGLATERNFASRNCLLSKLRTTKYYNQDCKGMNAGFTVQGGECVVTIARPKDSSLSYLSIVMGGTTDGDGNNSSYILTNKLVKWAFRSFEYKEVLKKGDLICELPVEMSSDGESVLVVPEKSLSFFLPKSAEVGKDIILDYTLSVDSLTAPVTEGTPVGFISVKRGDEVLGTVNLVTKFSVAKSKFLYALEWIKELSQSRFFKASVISGIIITAIYIVSKSALKASRTRKRGKLR